MEAGCRGSSSLVAYRLIAWGPPKACSPPQPRAVGIQPHAPPPRWPPAVTFLSGACEPGSRLCPARFLQPQSRNYKTTKQKTPPQTKTRKKTHCELHQLRSLTLCELCGLFFTLFFFSLGRYLRPLNAILCTHNLKMVWHGGKLGKCILHDLLPSGEARFYQRFPRPSKPLPAVSRKGVGTCLSP